MARASVSWSVAVSVPAVVWGLVSGFFLFGSAESGLGLLSKGCPGKVAYSWRSNISAVDNLLCTLVNFLGRAQGSDDGKWITGYVGTLLISVLAFTAVEGSRLKSHVVLSLAWLHGVIFQVIGIAVSFPLLWLTTYFLTGGGNRDPSQIWKKKISLRRVAAIAFLFLFIWLNSIALFFPLRTDLKQWAILLSLVMPGAVMLAYLPFTTTPDAPQQRGHKGVIALHLLHAGLGLTWHLVGILYVFRDPQIPGRVFRLFATYPAEEFSVHFLAVDVVCLFLSVLYLTAVEDGILIALLELVAGVVFGPAFAFSAYCVFREQSISKAVSSVKNKRKD